ncbi:MAG: SPOR domain-containing protein [Pseudomonadota bacterium]
MALVGWGAGALVAIGAYFGALQFYPAEPSMPLMATFQSATPAIDPIMTGSIGGASSQPMPSLPSPLQARLDSITMEMAALRDALAAAQASTVSTNRRLTDIEQNLSFMTASIGSIPGEATEQALPDAIEPLTLAVTEPRVVLPAPTPADGGSITVSMRPLTISTDEAASEETASESTDMSLPSEQPLLAVSQTPFAIDIGGAATLEDIDALWMNRKNSFSQTLGDLTPRILLQQTSTGTLDLRLVAGPINDAADAAILCAQLVAAGLERCLPAIFDGQQLALR